MRLGPLSGNLKAVSHSVSPTFLGGREGDIALRDGTTVHVRTTRPSDREGLKSFLLGLSEQSRYFRFFSLGVNVKQVVERSIGDDPEVRYGLVATTGPERRVVAHAIYIATAPDRAEVAFAVSDEFQGKGIATILLGQLAEVATAAGISSFEAVVLPENRHMVGVFRESGFQVTVVRERGDLAISFPTAISMFALDRFDSRELSSSAAAVDAFLRPRSVAVIGASRAPGSVGGSILRNLIDTGYSGPVYPVNSHARTVQDRSAYRSVGDITDAVDLAVIAVPAPAVIEVARDCAAKGVRGLLVLSAGFGEAGAEGADLQRELVQLCRETGMRLIGPNCIGLINTAPEIRLNATFASDFPPRGHTAMLSQSGALGLAMITRAADLGLGISQFVSVGNKADISGNDLLGYWADDPETQLILMYLESFGNPRKFSRLARRVARQKPIVAVKSGRSQAGARASSSHTGALLAASDVTVDALFRQAGVIRTDTLGEMFDLAKLLAHQPAPAGKRVGVVSNAGGPGILCADACEAAGLTVPQLSAQLVSRLRSQLPQATAVGNPVNLLATAAPGDYNTAIELIAESNEVDAVVALAVPMLGTSAVELAGAIGAAATVLDGSLPLMGVMMSGEQASASASSSANRKVPWYQLPEDAAQALARAAEYGRWRSEPPGEVALPADIQGSNADAIIGTALAESPGWLQPAETMELLHAYGIPAATTDQGKRFLVQPMAPRGPELIIGMVHDPLFGPVIACGAGGTATELLNDVAVRITPVTDRDATTMLKELRTFPLLNGYRGAQPCDVAALEDIILRLSAMVEAHEEIAEVDLNPVLALPGGALVGVARIRLEKPAPRTPVGARR